MGWSLAYYLSLPEWEQLEWLADDEYHQKEYRRLMRGLKDTRDGKAVLKDFGSYIGLLLRRL